MMDPKNKIYKRFFKNTLISLAKDIVVIDSHVERSRMNFYPEMILNYVVSLEDRRFYNHCGLDVKSIIREGLKFSFKSRNGGASTIDMQMVRTITNFKEKTFYRKIYESILAIIVNCKYSKKEIINCYLDNAFFGSQMNGLERAAKKSFMKEIWQLNEDEMASLAAMLKRPRPLKPKNEWKIKNKLRADYAKSVYVLIENNLEKIKRA